MAGTANGIVLAFSKPMNPVQASNVSNYTVGKRTTFSTGENYLTALGLVFNPLLPDDFGASNSTRTVPLRAAEYDPANYTGNPDPQATADLQVVRRGPRLNHREPGIADEDLGPGPGWVKLGPRSH